MDGKPEGIILGLNDGPNDLVGRKLGIKDRFGASWGSSPSMYISKSCVDESDDASRFCFVILRETSKFMASLISETRISLLSEGSKSLERNLTCTK